ncbi:MAG TPA: 16S rRNA (cytosine(967)-C(5))-methyltransferase RsmB, partial [Thermoanaerobaculia bacterium]
EIKWRISEGEIGRLSRQALRLLESATPLVAPGGRLVAITCSLEREENEDVVARFLATHPELSPLSLDGMLESPVSAGVTAPGTWRILTGGDHDGFTVQVLAKARI